MVGSARTLTRAQASGESQLPWSQSPHPREGQLRLEALQHPSCKFHCFQRAFLFPRKSEDSGKEEETHRKPLNSACQLSLYGGDNSRSPFSISCSTKKKKKESFTGPSPELLPGHSHGRPRAADLAKLKRTFPSTAALREGSSYFYRHIPTLGMKMMAQRA